MLKIVILGCGSSTGVPVIGCKCNVCISEEKLNKRTHSSIGYKLSKSNAHIDLVLSWVEKINPQKVILTHMGYEIDYVTLKKKLPNFIEPAYDGIII